MTNGGSGYTSAPTVTISGGGTPATHATAHAVIDTDPTSPTYGQVTEIDIDNAGAGLLVHPSVTSSSRSGRSGTALPQRPLRSSSNAAGATAAAAAAAACYPSVVNYTPLYYLINGVAFDITNSLRVVVPDVAPALDHSPAMCWSAWSMPDRACTFPSIVGSHHQHRKPRAASRWLRKTETRFRELPRDPERSLHGRGQDLRRDDRCPGCRAERRCRSSIAS